MPALRVFEVGERYGKLTVIQRRGAATPVVCRCDCGVEKEVNAADLVHKIRSCGHCTRWAAGEASPHWRGGVSTHPLYEAYQGMLARCHRPTHHKYPSYGGRGITVCDRWRDFASFHADMGDRPEGRTLDRINNDGNYEPGNCRWATAQQQRHNRRDTPTKENPS